MAGGLLCLADRRQSIAEKVVGGNQDEWLGDFRVFLVRNQHSAGWNVVCNVVL